VFLDYNQNAKDRTVASAYSVRPLADARVSFPLRWDEVADVVAEDFTLATVPALYQERGDAGAGIDESVGSLDSLLELSARDEAEGRAMRRGRRTTPSRRASRRASSRREAQARQAYEGRGRTAGRRPVAVAAPRPWPPAMERGPADRMGGHPPHPTGRRKSSIRSSRSPGPRRRPSTEGLERWKGRHPEVVEHLEPADILTDGMRGRAYVWYRLRVNLIHVPEDKRPAQEPLDPDYNPRRATSGPTRAASRSGRRRRSRRRTAHRATELRQGCQRTIQAGAVR
jgi:hypothetical protein